MTNTTLDLESYRHPTRWKRARGSKLYDRLKKLEALIASNFCCAECGTDQALTIHHLTRIKGQRDERVVLCVQCHRKAHGE